MTPSISITTLKERLHEVNNAIDELDSVLGTTALNRD